MTLLKLKFILKSDATFGRGDGVAGFVDSEVQHDEYGLPFLGGRALKGLLEEECANILFALKAQNKDELFFDAARHLFGCSGSSDSDKAILHIGDARLPHDLQKTIAYKKDLNREQVLNSLTAIRHQTAIDEETGASKEKSLRAIRVILRETPFEADISFIQNPSGMDLPLLAACIKAFKKAGTGRNRGRGELTASLYDEKGNDITIIHFLAFRNEVIK